MGEMGIRDGTLTYVIVSELQRQIQKMAEQLDRIEAILTERIING